MNFNEKYTTQEKKTGNPEGEKDKSILSNDAFAIGDTISDLINKLEIIRRSFLK